MSNTLNDLRYQLKRKAQLTARRMDGTWQAELRTTSPHDSYAMRNATTVKHTQSRDRVVWTAEADTDYAPYVSGGTRAHWIFPKHKKVLRFVVPGATFGSGGVVFASKVYHPGTSPNPWWTNSMKNASRRLQKIWDSV